MNNNKICTSIEQSRHLVDLGISTESSDMYYEYIGAEQMLSFGQPDLFDNLGEVVPAWSIVALMKLMPVLNEGSSEEYRPFISKTLRGQAFCTYMKGEIKTSGPTELDAAYNMVCKLIEKGDISNKKVCEINVEELEIGNYIGYPNFYPEKIEGLVPDIHGNYQFFNGVEFFELSSAKPLPLTESIFISNGFKKGDHISDNYPYDTDEDGNKYYSLEVGNRKIWGWWQSDKTYLIPTNGAGYIKIKYIHQLQNIIKLAGINIKFNPYKKDDEC